MYVFFLSGTNLSLSSMFDSKIVKRHFFMMILCKIPNYLTSIRYTISTCHSFYPSRVADTACHPYKMKLVERWVLFCTRLNDKQE
jgi:ribosomal protein L36